MELKLKMRAYSVERTFPGCSSRTWRVLRPFESLLLSQRNSYPLPLETGRGSTRQRTFTHRCDFKRLRKKPRVSCICYDRALTVINVAVSRPKSPFTTYSITFYSRNPPPRKLCRFESLPNLTRANTAQADYNDNDDDDNDINAFVYST